MAQNITPTVGMGATLCLPSDRYPYVITETSADLGTLTLEPLLEVSKSTGHKPASYAGPFPVWDHTYTEAELYSLRRGFLEVKGYLDAHGDYRCQGGKLIIGEARYYRNYSD
jgi:hypothetical protein